MPRSRLLASATLAAALAAGPLAAASVAATIDADETRQTIEGFGTCLVSWGKVARSDFYNEEMARIYAQDMGFNMLRVNVAPWGYPQTEDPAEINWEQIDLAHKDNSRVGVFIEFAKKVQVHQPELRLIGTVWSPPGWMKVNGEITGGKNEQKREPSIHGDDYKKKDRESRNRVTPKYYQHFVELMVAMARLHQEEGVPFYALSAGNEVMFSQGFESCVWTAKDFATITGMLGDALEREGMGDVLLFGPETMTHHNWSIANPLYIKELQANPSAWKHLDRFATHGYVDGFKADMSAESSNEFWSLIKDEGKAYWMTEGGTGGHTWPEPLTAVAAAIHNSLVYGNASAFVPWQVASGNGEENTHALMAGHAFTKKSHAARHFSTFIDPDAQRLDVPEDTGALRVSAFRHPKSGKLTVVAINPDTAAHELTLSLKGVSLDALTCYRTTADEDCAEQAPVTVAGGEASLELPAQCIVTLVGGG